MKKQYWMKLKYNNSGRELWELTSRKYADENAVRRAYEAQSKSLNYTILETKPHEQFEFHYDKEPATGRYKEIYED